MYSNGKQEEMGRFGKNSFKGEGCWWTQEYKPAHIPDWENKLEQTEHISETSD